MDKTFIKTFIDYIRNGSHNEAIEFAYDNIDSIKKLSKEYGFNINNVKLIDVTKLYSFDELNKNFDDIPILSIYRMGIISLIDNYKTVDLYEKNELQNNRTNIKYSITVADDTIKTKLFILYLLVYYIECRTRIKIKEDNQTTLNNRPHVAIDYEFFRREIALMQINFETYSSTDRETNSFIWLVHPGEFDETMNNTLIKYLMTNNDIYKIMQGPDSQDIPYMYEKMFNNNKDVIVEFTSKLIDTKFLCDYFQLSVRPDRKCAIYDALNYFETISQDKYDELNRIHDLMGPVQDIAWNIHKLSSYHLQYAFYDVLFLKHFLIDIYKKINTDTPDFIDSYKYVNPVVRFVLLDRRNIHDIVTDSKNINSPINNYLIRHDNKKYTLISIFNSIIENFKVCDKSVCIDYNFILLVGFMKTSIINIFKTIIYFIIRENYTVYKNKTEVWRDRIDINIIYKKLDEYKFTSMTKLFDLFKNEAYKRIITNFPR